MKRLLTAGLLAGMSLTGTAFAQDAAAPAADGAAPAFDAGTVLASVNGVDITLGHAIVMRDRLPQQYQSLPDDVLMKGIVDQLVDQTLLAAKASAGPDSDPLEVRLMVENERRSALAARVVQSEVGAAVIPEEEIQAAYDAQIATMETTKEFRAAHILVESEEEAVEVKALVDAGGDFAELAGERSSDPGSAPKGGELGWFGPGQMVPEFEAAVAAMEPGAISDPVKSQFGWHVIMLEEVRDSVPPPLAQVRVEIESTLRQTKLEDELAALHEAATIDRPETGIPPEAIRQSELLQN